MVFGFKYNKESTREKPRSARELGKDRFGEELSTAYDKSMKKKLMSDAEKQGAYDAMTTKEKFSSRLKKGFDTAKKVNKKVQARRKEIQRKPLEQRSKPFEP